MENKKHLPLRIVNSILLLASLVFCVMAMIKNPTDTSVWGTNPLTTICDVLSVLMLAFGLVYMMMNYSKNASIIYKAFFAVLFIGTFVQTVVYLTSSPNSPSVYFTIFHLISVAAIAVLAMASDLGKKKTMLLTIVVVLCRSASLIRIVTNISKMGTATVGVLSGGIANFLIAFTTGVMVIGKYLDKAERGTK